MSFIPNFNINQLCFVNTAELQKVIEWILTRLKTQDDYLIELKSFKAESQQTQSQFGERLDKLDSQAIEFEKGLEDLLKLQDRVDAFSQRFVVLEEKMHCLTSDTIAVENKLYAQVADINAQIKQTKRVIDDRCDLQEKYNFNEFSQIKDRINEVRTDGQLSCQELERKFQSFEGKDDNVIYQKTENSRPPQSPETNFKLLQNRIMSLESLMKDQMQGSSMFSRPTSFDMQDSSDRNIQQTQDLNRQKEFDEINNKINWIIEQLTNDENGFKEKIKIQESRIDVLNEKIKKFTQGKDQKMYNIEKEIKNNKDLIKLIQESINQLKQQDNRQFAQYRRKDTLVQHQNLQFLQNDIINDKISDFDRVLIDLVQKWQEQKESIQILSRQVQDIDNIVQLELIVSVQNHENMIIDNEKNQCDIQDTLERHISQWNREQSDQQLKLKQIQSSFQQSKQELIGMKQQLGQLVQEGQTIEAFDLTQFSQGSDQQLDTSAITSLAQAVKKHEIYIKQLSQKVQKMLFSSNVTQLSDFDQIPIDTDIQKLEQFKQEMKIMISKQNKKQALGQQEIDLINQIKQEINDKVSKSEFMSKVDRPELDKIYKALKRRIQDVKNNIKMIESTRSRDDAFFMKKGLNPDCAACGQVLPDTIDTQNTDYKVWGQMRPKVPALPLGPGFSRILSSIVQTDRGYLTLPKKSEDSYSHQLMPRTPVVRLKNRSSNKLPRI